MPPNSCSIYHTRGGTFSRNGAFPLLAFLTVASFLRLVILVKDLSVVSVNVLLKVWHAAIIDLDGVLIQYFVKGVVFWEVF